MPRLGLGMPIISGASNAPVTVIDDVLWEDFGGSGGEIAVNYQETRTNSILHSQDATDAEAWTKGNTAIDSTLYEAPDNSTTANAIKSNSTGEKVYNINQTVSVTAGKTYTLSAHVKKQNLGFAQLRFSDGDGLPRAQFNLTTGAITSANNTIRTQVDAMDNDWFRCSITFVATTSSGSGMVMAQSAAGDGTPNIAVSGIVLLYVWGFQLEESIEATPYIVTTTSARTATTTLNDTSDVWDFDGADLMPEADPDSEGVWEETSNLVLNHDYEDLGSELAPASDFASNFESSPSSGAVSQSNGTITFDNATSTGTEVQLKNRSISTGEMYQIQFTISNYSAGNFRMSVGNQTSDAVSANGTYTFYVQYNNGLARNYFYSNSSTLTVSNISVKQVDPNDRWTLGTGWSIEDGKLKSVNGGNYTTYQTSILTSGTTYEIKYTISDYSSGTFGVRAHTAAGITATANGTYTDIITSNGSHLYFLGFGTFNGSVDNVTVREYAIQPQDV